MVVGQLRRAFSVVSLALAMAGIVTVVVSAAAGLLVDGEFDDAADSADLRSDGAGRDWYESLGDLPELLTLNASAVGGNVSGKAAFAASPSGDAYLSQEFSTPVSGNFGIQWDTFLGSVVDVSGPDRAAWMLIGDASEPAHPGPNSDDAELFVVLAFAKSEGGSAGEVDLVAQDRDDEWSTFTPVTTGLSLQQWYTIKVVCDLQSDTYDVYVNEAYAATISARHPKDAVSHVSFAQRSDGAGEFYVDNVYEITILQDIDSGLASPTENYRWRDIADQLYAWSYRTSYNYTQGHADVLHSRSGSTFQGTLRTYNLKPNFAYQLKLAGISGTEANERIGLAGRWWQEEWDGAEWADGQNLNEKGDGSSPNPNDDLYYARSTITDATSETGYHYRYSGYLVFGYFVTDENGNAVVPFDAVSSYHVLWKTTKRSRTEDDGPPISHTFDPDPAQSPAYSSDYGEQTVVVFGEWERLPVGGVRPEAGEYDGQLVLTEESFHGSGGSDAGGWAATMGADVAFRVGPPGAATVASFAAAPRTGARPLTVTFSNDSYGDYDASLWSFGDGLTSTVQHPLHVYESAGVFTVSLTVSDPGGTDSLTCTHYINAYEPVSATFTGDPLTGTAPLTVTFTNGSTGGYDAILWSFGDGLTSTLENPVHVYAAPGVYSVSLTVSGPEGSSALARTNYINAYACAVSGGTYFWNGAEGVPGVLLALDGTRFYAVTSAESGAYEIDGVLGGDYTLVPSKSDYAHGIASYDASLVLRHSEGVSLLEFHQVIAADVNEDAAVNSTDALHVLQYAVGAVALPFPGAGAVWVFDPPSRSYPDLKGDIADQNFAAILLGDVSGNWTVPADEAALKRPAAEEETQAFTATLSLPSVSVVPGEQITVPLALTLPEGEALGVDITLIFDQGVVSPTGVIEGELASGWSMASNLGKPGEVRVALAGATPIVESGELLAFVFKAVGSAGSSTDLTLTRGDLNEGQLPADLSHGHVSVATPVQAGFTASPASGVVPLIVDFTNSSSGDFTSSLWGFGDDLTSTLTNPTHEYSAKGVYTVTLTVNGSGGVDTLTRTNYITAYAPVSSDFSANPLTGIAPLTVTFTNLSAGDYSTSLWVFGDGVTSTLKHPVHAYPSTRAYTVSLTVSGPGGSNTFTRTNYITAYSCTVSGGTYFWNGGEGVPRTLLALEGTRVYSSASGISGAYEIGGVLGGDYTLTPSKDDDIEGISPYDASFALRHAAGIITLAAHQAAAADVNGSGVVSSLDASYILQKSVDLIELPFPGAGEVWTFDPASRTYTDLGADQTDQDFTAVLLGDVSGNWSVTGAADASTRAPSTVDGVTATLSLPAVVGRPGQEVTVSLTLELPEGEVLGVGVTIAYDPTVISPTRVTVGSLAEGWSVASNMTHAGEVRVAMAGAAPVTTGGELLRVVFAVVGSPGSETDLVLTHGELNEGAIPVQLVDGRVGIFQACLPLIMRGPTAQEADRILPSPDALRLMLPQPRLSRW